MKSKVVILCLMSEYLPGFRSGGPIRTIANLINQLGDEFEIRVICRDRDLGDFFPILTLRLTDGTLWAKQKFFMLQIK